MCRPLVAAAMLYGRANYEVRAITCQALDPRSRATTTCHPVGGLTTGCALTYLPWCVPRKVSVFGGSGSLSVRPPQGPSLMSSAAASRRLVTANFQEQVSAGLREMIISGELMPGAVLSEVTLADTFGVSRTPVREALKQL